MATTNKFTKNLAMSRKDIKGKRAQLVSEEAKDAQEDLVRTLKQEYRELEKEQMNLDDIYPDDTTSMNAVKKDFNAKEWVAKVQSNKIAIALKKVELDTAEATLAEYFA